MASWNSVPNAEYSGCKLDTIQHFTSYREKLWWTNQTLGIILRPDFLSVGIARERLKKRSKDSFMIFISGSWFQWVSLCIWGICRKKNSYVCLELSRATRTSSRFYLSICNQLGERHMPSISKTICDEQKRQRPAMQLDFLKQEQLEDCIGIFILIQYNITGYGKFIAEETSLLQEMPLVLPSSWSVFSQVCLWVFDLH